jgi:RNA polymerase subunit RPABC4/transcription elongation factor Spt4
MMSDIPRGWAVIPKNAWYVAVAVALGVVLLMQSIMLAQGRESLEMPLWCWVLISIGVALVTVALTVLYGWMYSDAKRRGMRAVLWVLLGIFVPNMIGVILYLVLRDPLPVSCPKCSNIVARNYAYCPSCGEQVVPGCAQCGKVVEPGWKNCAHCGTRL